MRVTPTFGCPVTERIPQHSVSPYLSCVLLAALCAQTVATSASATEVWAFTDRLHPVNTKADARIIELDALARIEAALATQLPPDPKQATVIVQQRLKNGGADLHRRVAAAYQGVVDAWGLGIVKLPAIVVDRKYVVYGEPDVDRAVLRIEEYRSTRR